MVPLLKIAVVGSGIAGLSTAHALKDQAEVTLFEADRHFGGHAHTVDVTLPGPNGQRVTHGVDTGFLVCNDRTYPRLLELFRELDVRIAPSDMSFSVQVPGAFGPGDARTLEWSGTSLDTVFTQRGNLVERRFLGMLRDLLRFNSLTTTIARSQQEAQLSQPLGEFLDAHRFGADFRAWYLLPMLGCIWSCPTDQMLAFPVATMIRFCHNHGLLQVRNRPQWYSVEGGSREYVKRIVAGLADARLACPVLRVQRDASGVTVVTEGRAERFDRVVFATHPEQTLALLGEPSAEERAVLGAIRYQPNRAVLHTDFRVLPTARKAWAAWNYERSADAGGERARVCLHYLLNMLQPLPFSVPVIVSLNPVSPIEPQYVVGEYEYAHPVFDLPAIRAQDELASLQGRHHTWFCGAWTRYGFHEDGCVSGLSVARQLQVEIARHATGVDE